MNMESDLVVAKVTEIENEYGKKLLNVNDLANHLGCSVNAVDDLVKHGKIQKISLEDGGLFRAIDVAKFETGYVESPNSLDKSQLSALPSLVFKIEDVDEEEFDRVKNEYGVGSVYFDKQRNCWKAAFYMDENGTTKRKILSADSKENAFALMATLRSSGMAFATATEATKSNKRHTVSKVWEYILENQKRPNIKQSSYEWYKDISKPMLNYLGGMAVEEISSQDVQSFLNSLRHCEDGTPSSQKRIKEASTQLKTVLKYAHEEGYIQKNPFSSNVKLPKGVRIDQRESAMSLEEMKRLLGLLSKEESLELRTAVAAILLSGLRIGEFLALKYSELDRKNQVIHVNHTVHTTYDEVIGKRKGRCLGRTKTEAGVRTIPVSPLFFDVIENWRRHVYADAKRVARIRKQETQDIIFTSERGTIRDDSSARRFCNEFLKRVGFKSVNTAFHQFRRTYATLCDRAGISQDTISKLLGHENEDGRNQVARAHYIKEDTDLIQQRMKEAYVLFMEYVGDAFDLLPLEYLK